MPESLTEALNLIAAGSTKIVAGGTDFFPALQDNVAPGDLLDVSRIAELRTITRDNSAWRIGAAVSWSEIQKAELPACFDGLKLAGYEVGSWQIQNSGTIAGNICNASPAADGVPPLLVLNASVELSSVDGVRVVPLQNFVTGVRKIDLRDNEIVSAILIPDFPENASSHFLKLGARKYLVISIAMVSVVIWKNAEHCIEGAHVAVGSCSAVAARLSGLEAALQGKTYQDLVGDARIWAEHLDILSPISDIRGSREYRLNVAKELCRRTVLSAMNTQDSSHG